jgi:hypothetical protein
VIGERRYKSKAGRDGPLFFAAHGEQLSAVQQNAAPRIALNESLN